MSKRTNYFAVKTDDPHALRQTLSDNNVPAIIYTIPRTARDNWTSLPANRRWVVILLPPPWTPQVLDAASNAVELMVNNLTGDWSFRIVHEGRHLKGRYHGRAELISGVHQTLEVTRFSDEEQQFLATFFGVSFATLNTVLEPNMADRFCATVGIPYMTGIDQDAYTEGTTEYEFLLTNGYAVFADDLFD